MNTKIPLRTTSTNTNLPKTERNESIYQDWISGQSRKNLIIKYNTIVIVCTAGGLC